MSTKLWMAAAGCSLCLTISGVAHAATIILPGPMIIKARSLTTIRAERARLERRVNRRISGIDKVSARALVGHAVIEIEREESSLHYVRFNEVFEAEEIADLLDANCESALVGGEI